MKKDDVEVEVIKESVILIVTVFSVLFSNICVCEAVAPPPSAKKGTHGILVDSAKASFQCHWTLNI